ncbi:hypothetical protein JXA88_17165 [Candidatus Fermentibacteria bacterium]|nr:hypothetical protein [Candidatus Fermentibacteria bacterium]
MLSAVLILAAAIGGVLLWLSYGNPARWRSGAGLLPLLRIGSLILMGLLVLDIPLPVPGRSPRDWAVVVDGSASMTTPDTAGVSRADRGLKGLQKRLRQGDVLVAGESLVPVRGGHVKHELLTTPDTDLAEMVRAVWQEMPGLRRVILVSDGRRTVGGDPAAAARDMGLEVSCIGVGADGEAADLAIVDVVMPSVAIPDQEFVARAGIRVQGGSAPVPAEVVVELGGVAAAKADGIFPPDTTVWVDLLCPGLPPGRAEGSLQVRPFPGERSVHNNSRAVAITVRKARWAVRITADRPTVDTAFLARSLRRDGGFEVCMAIPGIASCTPSPGGVDVLVVGEWGTRGTSSIRQEAERTLRGGGAVILLGWPHPGLWRGLSPLLAEHAPGVERRIVPSRVPGHPLTALLDAGVHRVPLTFPGGSVTASPRAEVILETTDGVPAAAVQPWEGGYVLTWVGADWWRWLLADAASEIAPGPWPGMVRWLLTPEAGQRLRLHPGSDSYLAGQRITLGIEAFTPGWERATQGRVEVSVGGAGEPAAPVRRVGLSDGNGMTMVDLPGLPAGQWEVKAEAEIPGDETLCTGVQITVEEARMEQTALQPDLSCLERLASTTGGIMLAPGESSRLDSLLSAGSSLQFSPVSPRRTPVVYLLMLGLLGAEWWLRSRRGLP